MRNRCCIDSIDDYKSAVYLSIYKGGGLDPLQTNFRVFTVILVHLYRCVCSTRSPRRVPSIHGVPFKQTETKTAWQPRTYGRYHLLC
uniref:Uncharacterized protein n=1 Tax=Zea mays TaxID=4577 RepID=C4J7A8_MAIZE|nr:unknown [Zea mays]